MTRGLTRKRPRRRTPTVQPSSSGHLRALVLALLAVFMAVSPGLAAADVGQRLPRLTRLSDEVVRKGVPLGYVALRQLWLEWDQGDPSEVEAELTALTEDKRVAQPLR